MYQTAEQYLNLGRGERRDLPDQRRERKLKAPEDFTPDALNPDMCVQICPQPTSNSSSDLTLTWKEEKVNSTSDPKVFGPPLWFSYHNMAYHYPNNPTQIVRERMKGVILGIPYTLPCEACFHHATAYIQSKKGVLDLIVSSKKHLFNFFVDFHNYVNERFGKKVYTYEEAYALYGKRVTTRVLSYS